MAEYGKLSPCDIGRPCLLNPTQGAYQKQKSGVVVDETKTLLRLFTPFNFLYMADYE